MVNFLKIAPSTDPCCDIDDLLVYIKRLNGYPDYIHCDVMDKNFVEKDSITHEHVKQIYSKTLVPLDVHLMVNEPSKIIKKYIKSGAFIVTVHYEAFKNKKDLIKCLKNIESQGALPGISINPETDVMEIMPYLAYTELVLVMSVNPGKSGQRFLESTYTKVRKLKQIRDDYGARFKIEVDGGINPTISKKLKTIGADIVVSGSYIYTSEDKKQAIDDLK